VAFNSILEFDKRLIQKRSDTSSNGEEPHRPGAEERMRARMSVARGPHCGSIVSADLWRWANEEAKVQNINGRTPDKAVDSSLANWRQDSGPRIARWGRLESLPVTCVASTPGPNGLGVLSASISVGEG